MRWLVTGGCGFLGANLVRHLAAEGGHGIRIFDNLAVGTRSDLGPSVRLRETALAATVPIAADGVELVVGDILEGPAIARAAAGADIIVHFAANAGVARSVADPMFDGMTNVIGSLNCLEAARAHGIARFVFASSGAPIGEAEPPIHEDLPPHPVSPYGASKLAGEAYCSAYARCFGIATVALRFGNVYGPGSGRKTSVVAAFIARAQAGLPLVVYGDGQQTRDFIYVDDLVRAVRLAAAADGVGGEVFQIATNRETSVAELVDVLVPILVRAGLTPRVEYAAPRLGDVRRNFSDTSKAARMLGWRAEVGLRDGLGRTVDWFLAAEKEP
jgi:UDP-glucose 4-epimerase